MNAILRPKYSHCFDHAAQMIRSVPGLVIKDIYFNASGVVAEIEDTNAGPSEERHYRVTIQPID